MVNIGPLTAMISSRVWGTPANFKGFRVLALLQLLHRRRSTKVNQTLHDVWPSPGLLHYVYIFGGSFPLMEFCHVQNSLCIQVLLSPILAVLLHDTQAVGSDKTLRHRTRKGITELSLLIIFNRDLYSEGSHHVGHRQTF